MAKENELNQDAEQDTINSEEPTQEWLDEFDEIAQRHEDADDDHSEGTEAEADESPDDQGEEIPETLVAAGKGAGLSDDDISNLAENYPKVLEALAERQVAARPEPEPELEEPEPEEEPEPPIDHVQVDIPEGVDPATKAILEQMAANQNLLIDQLNAANSKMSFFEEETAQSRALRLQEQDNQIDEFFDSQKDICPALGENKTLNESQLAVRQEIFGLANAIAGDTMEERLGKAVKAYNGMNGLAEKNISRKLNKQKQRFSPRPGGKKTNPTYKNDDDKAFAAMDEAIKELGLDIS